MRLKSYNQNKLNGSFEEFRILRCAINCYLKMSKYIITEYNSMIYYLHYIIFI